MTSVERLVTQVSFSSQMRLGCTIQEWKTAGRLCCTPEHCFIAALLSVSTGLWGSRHGAYDASGGCMSMWEHNYTVCLRLHLYVSVSDVENCVCVPHSIPRETGLLSKLDSVIGSSENPNEAMSVSAAAPLPRAPVQSTGRPRPCLFKPDGKRCEMGSGKEKRKRWMNYKLFPLLWRGLLQNSDKYDVIPSDGGR